MTKGALVSSARATEKACWSTVHQDREPHRRNAVSYPKAPFSPKSTIFPQNHTSSAYTTTTTKIPVYMIIGFF